MATWTNNDGLRIKYGPEEVTPTYGGEVVSFGNKHTVVFDVELEDVTAVSSPLYLSDTLKIPNGAWVEKVKVTVLEVSVGTNANLDLGFAKPDRTEEDYNGLIAAGDAWHEGAVGTFTEYELGTTEAGALLGKQVSETGGVYITANYDTAAFTDGTIRIEITWVVGV